MPSVFDIFKSQVSDDQLSQMAEKLGADKSKVQDAISMSLPALIEALGRKAEQSPPRSQPQSRASQSSNSGGSMLDMLNETIGGGSTAPAPASQRSSQSAPQQFDDILPPSSPPSNKPQQSPPAHQHQSPSQRSPAPSSSAMGDILGQILGGGASSGAASGGAGGMADIFGDLLGNKRDRISDAVGKSSGLSKDQAGSLISMLGPLLGGALGNHAQQQKLSPDDLAGMLQKERANIQNAPGGGLFGKLLDQDGDGDFDMNDMLKLGMSMMFKK